MLREGHKLSLNLCIIPNNIEGMMTIREVVVPKPVPPTVNIAELYGLSAYNIDNITTLARFLVSNNIPPPKFDMGYYIQHTDQAGRDIPILPHEAPAWYNECGTVCCAAGHGPLAGIPAFFNEPWNNYVARAFLDIRMSNGYVSIYNFMFGGRWTHYPSQNNAEATAKRMFYFLKYGLPSPGFYDVEAFPNKVYPWMALDLTTESL